MFARSLSLSVAPALTELLPHLRLGVLTCEVSVAPSPEPLLDLIAARCASLPKEVSLDSLSTHPRITATRAAYRTLGKDPTRYRGSCEALSRRVLQGKGLYKISNVVDIINLTSLTVFHCLGCYDLAALKGAAVFRAGTDGESYTGIGKGAINLEGLPLFADSEGPFGTPTSDSERSMVRDATTKIGVVIIAFAGGETLPEELDALTNLFQRFAGGSQFDKFLVGA